MKVSKTATRPCLGDNVLIYISLLGFLVLYCVLKDKERLSQWAAVQEHHQQQNTPRSWYGSTPVPSPRNNAFNDLELGKVLGHGFVSWGFESRLHGEKVVAKVTTDKFLFYSDIEMDVFNILNAPPTIPNIPQLQLGIRSMPNPFTNQTHLQHDLGLTEDDAIKLTDARRISVQVMELLVDNCKPKTLPEFRLYLQSLLETLAFVHSRGIIHCDLHSNNVHFDGTRVSLYDWNGAFVYEPNKVKVHQIYAPFRLFPPEAQNNKSAVHATVSAFDIYTVGRLIKKAVKTTWNEDNPDQDDTLENRDEVLGMLVDLAKQALKEDPYQRPDAMKLLRHRFFSAPFILKESSVKE
jgi:hypothetical protein